MKKRFALAAFAALVIAVSTVAFVPSVRAQASEILNVWFRFKFETRGGRSAIFMSGPAEFTPLRPTYLPAGLQNMGGTTLFRDGKEDLIALAYHNDEQFVAITQSKVAGDKTLPAGREVSINGQKAALVTGLEGIFKYGSRIPKDAQGKTLFISGTPPAKTDSYHGAIAYTDGKRLTWYVGDVKIEMLSNLSVTEMLKIAGALAPAEAGEVEEGPILSLPPHLPADGVGEGVVQGGPIESTESNP